MNLLVLNCGSASVKFERFRIEGTSIVSEASGSVDARGAYGEAIRGILASQPGLDAVAHRVVHGGETFTEPVRIDGDVLAKLREVSKLAPLHNPAAIEGIEAMEAAGVPQVAVFDTAFHRTIPEAARRYAVPGGWRRFGFHGLSHQYVTERYAELAGSPEPTIVTLHLGGGCSATAVKRGKSVETSMGASPLEGLIMGTRPGDVDPYVVLRLDDRILNRESGLKAIAGTSEMREILRRDDADARLAIEMFCHRARKYVGAYLAVLGGAEAVVFTGGIGENAAEIRRRICGGFEWAGLRLDPAREGEGRISTASSSLHAWVIRTDEERLIAREAARLLGRKATA